MTNGEEALDFLEQSLPHMMICDIMMPRMNGLERLHTVNLKISGGVHDHTERIPGFRDTSKVLLSMECSIIS